MNASPLRVLIVDDEPLARARARRLLGDIGRRRRRRRGRLGPRGARRDRRDRPDLLLLDIQMPGEDGFALLESLLEPRPAVVFVTAFDHYAVRAFEENAVDYLLKPFRAERLRPRSSARAATSSDPRRSVAPPRAAARRSRQPARRRHPPRALHGAHRRAPADPARRARSCGSAPRTSWCSPPPRATATT